MVSNLYELSYYDNQDLTTILTLIKHQKGTTSPMSALTHIIRIKATISLAATQGCSKEVKIGLPYTFPYSKVSEASIESYSVGSRSLLQELHQQWHKLRSSVSTCLIQPYPYVSTFILNLDILQFVLWVKILLV